MEPVKLYFLFCPDEAYKWQYISPTLSTLNSLGRFEECEVRKFGKKAPKLLYRGASFESCRANLNKYIHDDRMAIFQIDNTAVELFIYSIERRRAYFTLQIPEGYFRGTLAKKSMELAIRVSSILYSSTRPFLVIGDQSEIDSERDEFLANFRCPPADILRGFRWLNILSPMAIKAMPLGKVSLLRGIDGCRIDRLPDHGLLVVMEGKPNESGPGTPNSVMSKLERLHG